MTHKSTTPPRDEDGVRLDGVDADGAHRDGAHLDGVTVRLGGRPVLRDLSLTLTERRICLVGRNGSGKSTVARVVKGLIVPETGRVRVHGMNPAERSAEAVAAVGFLFQNSDHQILCPTVLEEIAFGPLEGGLARAEAEERALALMRLHGVAGWRDRPVAALSEGQRRLVCLLAVLVMEPKLLVLDEPYTGLDIPTRVRLARFVAGLPQRILAVSHDPETIETADRVLWLEEGAVRADGPPATVLPAYLDAMQRAGAQEEAAE
ncbi:MAG: energy-coupling factor ABC transporter ATP-binding protein [Alphaproteobacteria bacterium]|nr:energy-coupling factor ABC transporter ATP-binding protein [Alphaproteobacteria bacterium]